MKRAVLIFLLLLCSLPYPVLAQKEAANWFFGDRAGLNFNTNPPTAMTGSLQTVEGSASISDKDGNLLFYTDGITVYDAMDRPMPHGTGLKGNVSSTQSALIVPNPVNHRIYYIFTVDKPDYFRIPDDPIEGVNYTIVDMSLNSGFGDVVTSQKNIHLLTYNPNDPVENEYKSSEKITAVVSSDCSSYWVVTQFVNRFYSFRVDANGVDPNPVVSVTPNSVPPLINEDDVNITAQGYLKLSPDGKKLAAAYSSTNLGTASAGRKSSGKVFLYDFDDFSGKVSNEQLLLSDSYPYGVEFSAETRKLYVTANIYNNQDALQYSELYQFDLESSNIPASKFMVKQSNNVAGALQLGINGKIYRAGYPLFVKSYSLLSVINDPEVSGDGCNYSHNSIDVSPADVKLGLPPFIQSLFTESFDFKNLCFGDATEFTAQGVEKYDSFEWDFGDGTIATGTEVSHTYQEAGTYTVVLNKYKAGLHLEPVCKQVSIIDIPGNPEKFELKQCDIQDSNPKDGLADFNLDYAEAHFAGDNSNVEVFFYETEQEALDDEGNTHGLKSIYRNSVPGQVIYAKVKEYGSKCFYITEVTLKTTESIDINPSPVKGCDLGNGKAEYDLQVIEAQVKKELALDENIDLSFYATEEDAALGQRELPGDLVSEPKAIFIRANSEDICYGSGSLELQLGSFPEISDSTEIQLCSSDFPYQLGSNISLPNPEDYDFLWNTGETSSNISISQGGTYSVEITSRELGCTRSANFTVEEVKVPEILDIEVESLGATNNITVITNEAPGIVYALDNIKGPYQSQPLFRDVPGGKHVLFAKNEVGCEIKQQEIKLFGFPAFFTPNQDGYNDRWFPFPPSKPELRIVGLYIFDRYGKLLKQLDPDGSGWDGTFNGKPMPADDYWFRIKLADGYVFKGHFSLKR